MHRLCRNLHAHTDIKADKHAYIHPYLLTCIRTRQYFWEIQSFVTNEKRVCGNGSVRTCISKSPVILGRAWFRYCCPMKSLTNSTITAHWWGSAILLERNFLAIYWPPCLWNHFGCSWQVPSMKASAIRISSGHNPNSWSMITYANQLMNHTNHNMVVAALGTEPMFHSTYCSWWTEMPTATSSVITQWLIIVTNISKCYQTLLASNVIMQH